MKSISLANELAGNSYPGRGIVIGKSADGKYAVTAYFIMGRRAETVFLLRMGKESVHRHLILRN